MKKRWNKRRLIPVALLMAMVLICGSVFAYMFMRTANQTSTFVPAKVSCTVSEEFNQTTGAKSSITVKNTGNIDAYLRVRLVSYWVDSNNNVAAKSSPNLELNYDTTNWIAGSDDTFYYIHPVLPGDSTPVLFPGSITLDESAEGFRQVVDVFAEAIQAKPADAATESWDVTLEDDGTITAAP